MNRKPYSPGRVYVGRIPRGADLLGAIARVANDEKITVGTVTVYGHVARASLALFDPTTREQRTTELERGAEIITMSGTISRFKGRSMPRLSALLSTPDGVLTGGTLLPGTEAHACEVVITELTGGTLTRDFDPETGLPLWREGSLLVDPADEEERG